MKLIRKIFLVILLITPSFFYAQNKSLSAFISNNVTSFPGTGYSQLFYSQLHPGIDVAKGWKINKSEKHQLWAVANAGLFYHRFVQTGLKIYPSIDYKFAACNRFSLNVGLGLGYMHSFEGYEVFKAKDGGGYETKKIFVGRPQFLAALNFGGAYKLKKESENSPSLVLQFRTNMQGPFVNSYVPVLPVNSLLLGVTVPILNK